MLEFVPRDQEIRELERCLLPTMDQSHGQNIFVLHGTGGMGKTRLAVQFAELHQHDFDSIFFLDGKTLATLTESFTRIVRRVTRQSHHGPSEANLDSLNSEATPTALKWFCLQENTKWLLIFDNVDTEASEQDKSSYRITDYFPAANWGSILITTRLTDLSHLSRLGNERRVNKMHDTQARQLLGSVLHQTSSRYHAFTTDQMNEVPGMKGECFFSLDPGSRLTTFLKIYSGFWMAYRLLSNRQGLISFERGVRYPIS